MTPAIGAMTASWTTSLPTKNFRKLEGGLASMCCRIPMMPMSITRDERARAERRVQETPAIQRCLHVHGIDRLDAAGVLGFRAEIDFATGMREFAHVPQRQPLPT